MGRGTAFGKTIFIGDQFVLQGVPAIVPTLPYVTVAEVEWTDGRGWILEDNRLEIPGYKEKKSKQQVDSINLILKVMKIDTEKTPIKITYGGDHLAGSGVGASAASCVSLARALNEEFSLGLSDEQINHIGWEGEFAYHGVPSGVDNTASTYGGIMMFLIQNDRPEFSPVALRRPVEGVLAASGVTADTSALRGLVDKLKQEDEALFQRRLDVIAGQVHEFREALEGDDLDRAGAILSANHDLLIEMGLSHEKLVHLCDLARQNGALGAKLTGGGMGGYAFALTPGQELQERVATAIEAEGFQVIRATYGGS